MHTAHNARSGQDARSHFAILTDARGALATGLRLILPPILLAVAAIFALPLPAQASGGEALVRPGEMRAGSLLLRSTEPGAFVEAPRIGTDVDIAVSGPTARSRVTQIFRNPTEGWV